MKPLIVLLIVFVLSLLVIRLTSHEYNVALSARIAMASMLLFTAISHFIFTEGMIMMLPDFVPYKRAIVYLTGFIEIAAAIGLLVSRFQVLTGWLLILFFILILPANIKSAIAKVNFQTAANDGDGLIYLWFRIPLQVIFIIWTYICAIRY